jgi:hypothetical protein
MNKVCISVRGFNRAEYLELCLKSLEKCIDVDKVDFFFIQDNYQNMYTGNEYTKPEEIKRSLKVFNKFKYPKVVYECKFNCGCALVKKAQLDILFDGYEYDYIVLVDNDLVFNEYFIKTHLALYEQFKDTNVASIQTSFRHTGRNYQTIEEALELQDKIEYGFSHRCELGMYRHAWENINKEMSDYWRMSSLCDFKELLYNKNVYQNERAGLLEKYGTEHCDFSLEKSIQRAGYKGIHTLTNRYKNIGEQGEYSFRGDRFKSQGFDKIHLYNVGNVDSYQITGSA